MKVLLAAMMGARRNEQQSRVEAAAASDETKEGEGEGEAKPLGEKEVNSQTIEILVEKLNPLDVASLVQSMRNPGHM